jgi:hypothetical protein
LVAPILVGAALAAPGVGAVPDDREYDDHLYHGLAREGTVDHAEEWSFDDYSEVEGAMGDLLPGQEPYACAASPTEFTIELRLTNGTQPDALLLEVPDDDRIATAVAMHDKPAVLEVSQSDRCVDFAVVGLAVSGEPRHDRVYQLYVVDA